MSESENERVVQKIFEAFNRQDLDAATGYLADDMTAVWPSGRIGGKEECRKSWASGFTMWPDGRYNIDRMVSQGNTVVVEFTFTGTYSGEWQGIPVTNKKVEIQLVHIYDFEAGKVKLWKNYLNVRRMERLLRE